MANEPKGIHWGWLVAVALVFAFGTYNLFPQVQVLDETDYDYGSVLAEQVLSLESQLEVSSSDFTTLESNYNTLEEQSTSQMEELADANTRITELEELPISTFSFYDWIVEMMNEAEEDADLTYNGTVYEGDDGEWDFDDIDGRECEIDNFDKDLEDGEITCDDVEIETDDNDDIECDIVIEFDEDMNYDDATLTNCVSS